MLKKWEVLNSSIALDEKWFKVRKDVVKLPSGTIMDNYFVWESPDISTVVPYTSDGKFVLCRQYRHGMKRVIFQFPAGAVGKNEEPNVAAKREMAEETGYSGDDFTSLSVVSVYPTKLTGLSYLFLAQNVKFAEQPKYDETEETEVVLMSPQELREMIGRNEMPVADSLTAGLLALEKLGL